MAPKGKARAKGKAAEAAEAVSILESPEAAAAAEAVFPDTLEDGSSLAILAFREYLPHEDTEAWHPPQPPHQDFSSFVLVFRFWYCLSLGTSLGSGIFYL